MGGNFDSCDITARLKMILESRDICQVCQNCQNLLQ